MVSVQLTPQQLVTLIDIVKQTPAYDEKVKHEIVTKLMDALP